MALEVEIIKKKEGVFTVALTGSIDSDTSSDLERELKPVLGSLTKAIVFDMAGVRYISSMGLGVIFKTKAALESNQGTLAITNIPPQIKEVFDVVKVIPDYVFTDMEKADDYLDAFLADLEKKDKKEE